MDNPEKLATDGSKNEEKQNKTTMQYVSDTTTVVYANKHK
jgi:hypothetical protein